MGLDGKEILIDGVNVAECENCIKAISYRCSINHNLNKLLCSENPNCYFKQLQRLKAENKLLKGTIKDINIVAVVKENEELKEERLEIARLFDKTCRCDDLQEDTGKCQYFNDDCISIRHCMKKFRSLKDSYQQALEEIREVAIRTSKNTKIVYNHGYHIALEQILKKINEVL